MLRVRREAQVLEVPFDAHDGLDRSRVREHGDQLHAASVAVALEHVDFEGMAQKLRPAVVAVR